MWKIHINFCTIVLLLGSRRHLARLPRVRHNGCGKAAHTSDLIETVKRSVLQAGNPSRLAHEMLISISRSRAAAASRVLMAVLTPQRYLAHDVCGTCRLVIAHNYSKPNSVLFRTIYNLCSTYYSYSCK